MQEDVIENQDRQHFPTMPHMAWFPVPKGLTPAEVVRLLNTPAPEPVPVVDSKEERRVNPNDEDDMIQEDDESKEGQSSMKDAKQEEDDVLPPLRRSQRTQKRPAYPALAMYIASIIAYDEESKEALASTLADTEIDTPGSDPAPFHHLPRSVLQTPSMPPAVAKAWQKAFVKEFSGILVNRQTCKIEDPLPDDTVVPVMEVYRCKLDQDGMVDKLKCRIVFRGDLYDPADPQDSWNPHASFLALKIFLAECARLGIFPSQIDFVLAYLQANMRERVFIKFPDGWKRFLPDHLHKWCGCPLKLLKALYGYNYSGKFLYQDQADFLRSQGLEESGIPGLWVKHLTNGKKLMFLHYSDDIMCASNCDSTKQAFLNELKKAFDIEVKPRADWYLQTRIQQDEDGNITLDQTRYAKSMVTRFLPNLVNVNATPLELRKYAPPFLQTTVLTKEDRSKTPEDVRSLEEEYGFRFIELVGCLNWLAYTCYEEIFAIRKLCRFMNLPGRPHFQAALHLLHHFRCHPPRPLIYYRVLSRAPITRLLKEVPDFKSLDPLFVVFADSAHADCDEGKSTACDLQVFQGGLVDHISWVPNPVPLSTAESENQCYSAAIMRAKYTIKAICKIVYNSDDANYTIPVCVDSSAAIAMNTAEKPTRKTRHVASRFWYG